MTDEGEEEGLLGKLVRVFSVKDTSPEAKPDSPVKHGVLTKLSNETVVGPFKISVQKQAAKRSVSAEHLQSLILAGLQKTGDFPKAGVSVSVYGFKPWNAMITFAPGSVSSKTAIAYREMLPQLIEALRKQFDVE